MKHSMKRGGSITVNGTVIMAETIRREWNLVKKNLLKNISVDVLEKSAEIDEKTLQYAKENVIARHLLELEAIRVIEDIPYAEIQAYYEKIVVHFGGEAAFRSKFHSPTGTSEQAPKAPIHRDGSDGRTDMNIGKMAAETTQQANTLDPFAIKLNIEKSLRVERLIASWEQRLPQLVEADFRAYYDKNRHLYPAKERILVTIIESAPQTINESASKNTHELASPASHENTSKNADESTHENTHENTRGNIYESMHENTAPIEEEDVEHADEAELASLQRLQDFYEESLSHQDVPQAILGKLVEQARNSGDLIVRERVHFERGTLEPNVEDYLFQLADERLSGLVRAGTKIYLFWKWRIIAAGTWEFSQVYESIKKDSVIARRNELVREKLASLREQAYVEDNFVA